MICDPFSSSHNPQMPSLDIYSLIPKLREAYARHETSSQKMYALRSGPLLATTSHLLTLLAEASPIAMINFAEMRNPYIASSAPSTTWHAPVTGFSSGVVRFSDSNMLKPLTTLRLTQLTVCLGGIWRFGNTVDPLKIINKC